MGHTIEAMETARAAPKAKRLYTVLPASARTTILNQEGIVLCRDAEVLGKVGPYLRSALHFAAAATVCGVGDQRASGSFR
jgi:hypothetical protein